MLSLDLRRALSAVCFCTLVICCSAQQDQPTELEIGSTYEQVVDEQQYGLYEFTASVTVDTLVYIRVKNLDGDSDLYVSDNDVPTREEYTWKSNTLGGSKVETVALLASAGVKRYWVSVYAYRGIRRSSSDPKRCAFELSLESEVFEPTPLLDEVPLYESLTPGAMSFFAFSLDNLAGTAIEEVTLTLEIANRDSLASREDVFVIAALKPSGLLVQQPQDLIQADDETLSRLFKGNVKRGNSQVMRMYLDTSSIIYLSLSPGLMPAASWEDTSIGITLLASTKPIEVKCLPVTTEEPPSIAIGGDEVHYWAVPFPSDDILRVETDTVQGQTEVFRNEATWPLPHLRSTHADSKTCGECSLTVEATSVEVRTGSVLQDAARSCEAYEGNEPVNDRYVLLGVRGIQGRTSQYTMSAIALDRECGWRPSCQSCADGGSGCTWCTSRGGHCDTVGAISTLFGSCDQAAWCPQDLLATTCASASTCQECSALPDCGWCGNANARGVCAKGTRLGPSTGVCDVWMFNQLVTDPLTGRQVEDPVAACARECSVHEAADSVCEACTLEPVCGLCASSYGQSCMHGDVAGSLDGVCPTNRTWWVDEAAQCESLSTEVGHTPTLPGKVEKTTLSLGAGDGCYLGSCKSAVWSLKVPAGIGQNIAATASVTPEEAVVRMMMKYDQIDGLEAFDLQGVRQQIPIMSSDAPSPTYAQYGVVDSICEEESETTVYFTLVLENSSPVDRANVEMSVEVGAAPLKVELDAEKELERDGEPFTSSITRQQTCCGGISSHRVEVEGRDTGYIHVAVEPEAGKDSPIRVYARAGACPTATSFDLMSINGTIKLEYFQDVIHWYIGVMNPESDHIYYDVQVTTELVEVRKDDGAKDWVLALVGAGVAVGVLLVLAVAAYFLQDYIIKRRATGYQLTTALVQNSEGLASDLEMPAVRLEHDDYDAEDAKAKALSILHSGKSDEEQELVGLIEGLSAKVVSLEKENKSLRKGIITKASKDGDQSKDNAEDQSISDSPIYVPSQYPPPKSQFAATPLSVDVTDDIAPEEISLMMADTPPPSAEKTGAFNRSIEVQPPPGLDPMMAAMGKTLGALGDSDAAPAPPPEASAPPSDIDALLQSSKAESPSEESAHTAKFRVELLCPDGSALLCSHGNQTIGRGMGGITQKKVSREHANLHVDSFSGRVVITVLGKNSMGVRGSGEERWGVVSKGEEAVLKSGSEFSLLVPDMQLQDDNVAFMVLIERLES